MCLVCVEWQAGKLTAKEAYRNIGEMVNAEDDEEKREHLFELSNRLLDAEVPFDETDKDVDGMWWDKTHKPSDE